MSMHTYQIDNYGVIIDIKSIKQSTLDDLKTLEEYGETMAC